MPRPPHVAPVLYRLREAGIILLPSLSPRFFPCSGQHKWRSDLVLVHGGTEHRTPAKIGYHPIGRGSAKLLEEYILKTRDT